MPEGKVIHFDPAKGAGIIETESGEELPVHKSALGEGQSVGLYAGDLVEFTVGRNKFGKRAAQDVRRIGWEEEEDSDEPREWNF